MEKEQKSKLVLVCFILMILSFSAAVVCIVLPIVLSDGNHIVGMPLGQILLYILGSLIAGGFAHKLANKDNSKFEKAVYYMTFLQYALSFILILIVFSVIQAAKRSAQEQQTSPSDGTNAHDDRNRIIRYDGKEIELFFVEQSHYYNRYNDRLDHPYYGKLYIKYYQVLSEYGKRYWLSFDDGNTFIPEDDFNPFTYTG